ncbi:N-acetylmuramoyl-L-alanine amidase [Rhodococcus hoagii]|nr:N-acetylmuramoyl-L-alanine amidase [Prescottella equi]NKV32764.1 N-acetylmuramoyl-L-alanine amidase [Prescottella equi]
MPDYATVTADYTRLMGKHFTPGRGGRKIRYIVRHHNAGISTTDDTWQTWQARQASAHYQIEVSGRVGQLVNDWDTAWANGNQAANQDSITIEHSNNGGAAQDWPISDATIEAGAKWAAALCLFYKLGRPQHGVNIRDHRDFYGTACPYHLAKGGKYHDRWMRIAQEHYDALSGATKPKTPGGPVTLPVDRDIRAQLTGSPNDNEYPGFEFLGGRTTADALGAIGAALKIPGFRDPKAGK